jgi:hypothetical protein
LVNLPARQVRAEKLVESSIFFRIAAAFSVDQKAVQEWLPTPWKAVSMAKGPFKGTNVIIILDDKFIQHDGDGKLFKDGAYCGVGFLAFGKNQETDEFSIFVTRYFWPFADKGGLQVAMQATVTREATIKGATSTSDASTEIWKVQDNAGGTLEFKMTYQRGIPKKIKREAKARSNVDTDIMKIYRDERVVDLVMSKTSGVNSLESYELKTTIPELTKMFNGSEQLVGLAVMPARIREVYYP